MSMTVRRTGTLACALALLAALPAGAAAAQGEQAAGKRAPASVRVADCSISERESDSSASFEGRMRIVPGAVRMAMRFTLLERFGNERLHPVRVPELNAWRRSEPGVRVFAYTQRIRALDTGGTYRARVEFRWYGRDGRVIRSARKVTRPCREEGELANLRIADVRARPGLTPGTVSYAVVVENAGAVAAEGIDVRLRVDGATLDAGRIQTLGAGETDTVRFSGPDCRRRLRVDADPADSVHETNEYDNARIVVCRALGPP